MCLSPNPPFSFSPSLFIRTSYRCGGNIHHGHLGYGLLPFSAFPSRVPSDAKEIYILSEKDNRAEHGPLCATILRQLVIFMKERYPKALVELRRGDDPFLDLARLTHARVTICSASTFCLFPAIASSGTAHFPVTPLVANVSLGKEN